MPHGRADLLGSANVPHAQVEVVAPRYDARVILNEQSLQRVAKKTTYSASPWLSSRAVERIVGLKVSDCRPAAIPNRYSSRWIDEKEIRLLPR